jgi:antitoxin PrlF
MLQTVKLTSKYQTTIPLPVRQALHLSAGDLIGFEIKNHVVTLRRATPIDVAFTQALEGSLQEWASAADEQAFKDL